MYICNMFKKFEIKSKWNSMYGKWLKILQIYWWIMECWCSIEKYVRSLTNQFLQLCWLQKLFNLRAHCTSTTFVQTINNSQCTKLLWILYFVILLRFANKITAKYSLFPVTAFGSSFGGEFISIQYKVIKKIVNVYWFHRWKLVICFSYIQNAEKY